MNQVKPQIPNQQAQEQQLHVPVVIKGENRMSTYKVIDKIGKGGFATVFRCVDQQSGREYAVKITQKQALQKNKYTEKLKSEVRIHKQLHHENIVQLYDNFTDEFNHYMIMELCTCNSLSVILKEKQQFQDEEIQQLSFQLIQAIQYLKDHQIVHRDLKSQNIFVTQFNDKLILKLGDFGLASQLQQDEKRFTLCGTPNFLPPETLISHIFKRRQMNRAVDQNVDAETVEKAQQLITQFSNLQNGHDYQSDMWSLGCLLYQLSVGKPPFETTSIVNTYKRILQCKYNKELIKSVHLKQLIEKLLVVDPQQRITVEQAGQSLFLSFIKLKFLPKNLISQKYQIYSKSLQLKENIFNEDIRQLLQLPNLTAGSGANNLNVLFPTSAIQSQITTEDLYNMPLDNLINIAQTKQYNHYQQIMKQIFNKFIIQSQNINVEQIQPYIQTFDIISEQSLATQVIDLQIEDIANKTILADYDLLLAKSYFLNKQYSQQLQDNIYQQNVAANFNISHSTLIYIQKYVHIAVWLEVTRYGLTYQLTNGVLGEHYNDQTILVESPNQIFIDFYDKQQGWIRARSQYAVYFVGEKKNKLHEYFRNHIAMKTNQAQNLVNKFDNQDLVLDQFFELVYDQQNIVFPGQNRDVTIQEFRKYVTERRQFIKSNYLQVVQSITQKEQHQSFQKPFYVVAGQVNMLNNQLAYVQNYQTIPDSDELLQNFSYYYIKMLTERYQQLNQQIQDQGYFSTKSLQQYIFQQLKTLSQQPNQHVFGSKIKQIGFSQFTLKHCIQYNFIDHHKLVIFDRVNSHNNVIQQDCALYNDKRDFVVADSNNLKKSNIQIFKKMIDDVEREKTNDQLVQRKQQWSNDKFQ